MDVCRQTLAENDTVSGRRALLNLPPNCLWAKGEKTFSRHISSAVVFIRLSSRRASQKKNIPFTLGRAAAAAAVAAGVETYFRTVEFNNSRLSCRRFFALESPSISFFLFWLANAICAILDD